MIEFTPCDLCLEQGEFLCESCRRNRETINTLKDTIRQIAENAETRARNIATHNQRSHTSNTKQRHNMEIMFQCWNDAATYVRETMKRLQIT